MTALTIRDWNQLRQVTKNVHPKGMLLKQARRLERLGYLTVSIGGVQSDSARFPVWTAELTPLARRLLDGPTCECGYQLEFVKLMGPDQHRFFHMEAMAL